MTPKRTKDIIHPEIMRNLVESIVGSLVHLQPSRNFYNNVGIRQRRWGLLMRGETSPTVDELHRVAKYFGVELSAKVSLVQLTLFDKETLTTRVKVEL